MGLVVAALMEILYWYMGRRTERRIQTRIEESDRKWREKFEEQERKEKAFLEDKQKWN